MYLRLVFLKIEMDCRNSSLLSFIITTEILPYVGAYNVIIIAFNISGNMLLILALKKTGQTKTISSQFIIIMSISDLVMNTTQSILMIITFISRKNRAICWIRLSCQFLMTTFNAFSLTMIALIALDRYLHMRYLQRYTFVVTKKRGYFLAVGCFVFATTLNIIFSLPLPYNVPNISEPVYTFSLFPIACSIFILYNRAMKALRMKASQLTRSVITTTRTLSKAAMRITLCVVVLTLPMIIIQMLELVNKHNKFIRSSSLGNVKLVAQITYTSIAFWSSYIFISLNTPIRMLLRRFARYSCKRNTSTIGSTDKRT